MLKKQTVEVRVVGPPKQKPTQNYPLEVVIAVFATATQFMIGAVIAAMFIYVLQQSPGSLHGLLCALGSQFFFAQGIMTFARIHPWSSSLKFLQRKSVHAFLQICGLILISFGTIEYIARNGMIITDHSISGFVAHGLSLSTLGLAPFLLLDISLAKLVHKFLGLCTLASMCITMCTGVLTDSFTDFMYFAVAYVLVGFFIAITFFVILFSLVRWAQKLRKVRRIV